MSERETLSPAREELRAAQISAWYLQVAGYKQVSRRHCLIARVDVPWEDLRDRYIEENFGDTKSGIPSLGREQQEDYYRRCSARHLVVSELVMSRLRKLGAVAL